MEQLSVNGKEYEIRKLLGKGKGGYSFLAVKDGKKYVIKQIHHEPCSYYRFGNKIQSEIDDYRKLKAIGIRMPEMLEVDTDNEHILKEYIEGDTVYDLVLRDEMKDDYLKQIKAMCTLLYPANTNIDYFPTNFVVHDGNIFYIDYECNDYTEEWNFENWGVRYWSKTPEFLQYLKEHMETDRIISSMIAWATEKLDETRYAGWCLSFIEDALEQSNGIEIYGGDSAKESCEMYRDALHYGKPEKGAFVFFDCLCNTDDGPVNWGHCGISLGDGRVIHAWDRVRTDDYREIEKLTALSGDHPRYIGWVPIERVLQQKP